MDTPAEERFDQIVRLAAFVAGTPIALLSIVDSTRQWFKARVGLQVSETPREQAFCDHVVAAGRPMWVADAAADPRFAHNPLVTGEPHVRFYCGAPVQLKCGTVVGTVCVIDRVARSYDQTLVDRLQELAAHAAAEIERSPQAGAVKSAVEAFAEACARRTALFDAEALRAREAAAAEVVRRAFEGRAADAERLAEATSEERERALMFQVAEIWRSLDRMRKLDQHAGRAH